MKKYIYINFYELLQLISLLLLFFSFNGCSSVPVIQGGLPTVPLKKEIVLSTGDTIEIRFNYWPEMSDTQTIRPDGKISLALIDDVQAAGFSPEELDHNLTTLYESEIKNPDITVIIRNLKKQNIYVGGEVKTPGVLPLEKEMTLMEAVMASGGFDNLNANPNNVIVFRQVGNKRYAKSFDLKQVLISPESETIALAPNDIVFVTRKGIAEANEWVDQFIEGMIPRTLSNAAILYSAFDD